jgi:hypothetical protein
MMVATVRKAWLSANTVPSAVSMSHRRHAALAFITADPTNGRRRETWRILPSMCVFTDRRARCLSAMNCTPPNVGGAVDARQQLLEQAEQEYAGLKTAIADLNEGGCDRSDSATGACATSSPTSPAGMPR